MYMDTQFANVNNFFVVNAILESRSPLNVGCLNVGALNSILCSKTVQIPISRMCLPED